MMPDESARTEWKTRASDPASWLATARSHLFLAEKLNRDREQLFADFPATLRVRETVALFQGFAFFVGAAIENGLKAIIVKRHPQVVTAGGLDKKVAHHRLADLTKLAKLVPARAGTMERLESLTHFTEWAARYPLPRRPEGLTAAAGQLHLQPETLLEIAAEVLEVAAREAGEEAAEDPPARL